MSWGAYDILSAGHPIHHNADSVGGAAYGVKYPYKQNATGIRFWATPKGVAFEKGRIGRSYEVSSWLYHKGDAAVPSVTFEKPSGAPDPAKHIATLAGYDVSEDGPYFAKFTNLCDRLYVGQNASYDWNEDDGATLDMGDGDWLIPAQLSASNVFPVPGYFAQRPWRVPFTPGASGVALPSNGYRIDDCSDYGIVGDDWSNSGWAYKRETDVLNNHGEHEFIWGVASDPGWVLETGWKDLYGNPISNPASSIDRNLLYLVEKRYSHGPGCSCDPVENPRDCNDRILTGYRTHYWYKPAEESPAAISTFDSLYLVRSWCEQDGYPFIDTEYYNWMSGWAPWSISCGKTAFERTRILATQHHPYYAPTDTSSEQSTESQTVSGYAALIERVPPRTAFDLILYMQTVGYTIWDRATHTKQTSGVWNAKCYSIIHQIAPIAAKD